MRPCLISEWRSQPIVASWPTCVVRRGDAAAATITRTPQTRAAVGVALHAEREGHVRQAERVVEAGRARDGVLEVDEVRLGVGEDRLGRGRGRRRCDRAPEQGDDIGAETARHPQRHGFLPGRDQRMNIGLRGERHHDRQRTGPEPFGQRQRDGIEHAGFACHRERCHMRDERIEARPALGGEQPPTEHSPRARPPAPAHALELAQRRHVGLRQRLLDRVLVDELRRHRALRRRRLRRGWRLSGVTGPLGLKDGLT